MKKEDNKNFLLWIGVFLLMIRMFIPENTFTEKIISDVLIYAGGFLLGIWTQK